MDIDFVFQNQNQVLQEFQFYASHNSQNIDRRYQTFSEALASLSGIANFFMVFGYLLTNFLMNLMFMLTIINSLYVTPNMNENPKKKSRRVGGVSKFKEMSLDSQKVSPRMSGGDVKVEKKNVRKSVFGRFSSYVFGKPNEEKESDDNHNPLKIGFFEYVGYFVNKLFHCKQNKKQQLIRQASKTYESEMDIVKILRKVKEIEKLKILLLNENQLNLFDSLSKPMLYAKNLLSNHQDILTQGLSFRMSSLIKNCKKVHQNNQKMYASYENVLKETDGNNYINQRLLDLIDCDQKLKNKWTKTVE